MVPLSISRDAFSARVTGEYQTLSSVEKGESASAPTLSVPPTTKRGAAEKTVCPDVAISSVAFGFTVTCGTPEKEVVEPVILKVPFVIVTVPVVVCIVAVPIVSQSVKTCTNFALVGFKSSETPPLSLWAEVFSDDVPVKVSVQGCSSEVMNVEFALAVPALYDGASR